MRRVLPIVVTFLILLSGFLVYLHYQPSVETAMVQHLATTTVDQPVTKPDDVVVGPGNNAWVVQFDRQTGRRTYQFRADSYDNEPNRPVHVTRPVIEFFLGKGQIVHVEGDDGIIRLAPGAEMIPSGGVPSEPPRYGTLHHVVLTLYESAARQVANDPELTMRTPNVQFDNDTSRLFTQAYTDGDGRDIPADQVPVSIRGKEYDFDGTGLTLYWNDLDKRLKYLEIAHGKQLTVRNGNNFMAAGDGNAAPAPTPSPAPVPNAALSAPAANQTVAGPVTQPVASSRRYLAHFSENVRIQQNGQNVIRAPEMMVDFTFSGSNGEEGGSDTDAAAPAAVNPEPSPATAPPTNVAVATTQPAAQPVVVLWDGKLRIDPNDDPAAEGLPPGKAIVRFAGAPVLMHQVGQNAHQIVDGQCAVLTYRTADSSATLEGDAHTPLVLSQSRSDGTIATVTGSRQLRYSRTENLAVLDRGHAVVPDPNDPKSNLDARWEKNCIVHLAEGHGDQMSIQSADLLGNVVIHHPKFDMHSGDLTLAFDPGQSGDKNGSPALRQIVANGDAVCQLHEAGHRERDIAAQHLELLTAPGEDGRLYARTVTADGDAKASEDDQDIAGGHIKFWLVPSHQQGQGDSTANVDLEKLLATDSVHVTGKKGESASGDRVEMNVVNGHSVVKIAGDPAVLASKDSTIVGTAIDVSGADQTATVEGAGMLKTRRAAQAGQEPRPLRVQWQTSAIMDGKANEARITGDVAVQSQTSDGWEDTAHGQRLVLGLTPALAKAHTDDPDQVVKGDFDFLNERQVTGLSLRDHAQAETALHDPAGNILSRSHVWGDQIDYDATGRKMRVPGAGYLLLEKHGGHENQPAGGSPANLSGRRGVSFFQWQNQLDYDQASGVSHIIGQVVIKHFDDGDHPNPLRIDCDHVTAEFESDASTRPAGADDTARADVKRVLCEKDVVIATPGRTVWCGQAEFDPPHDRLICRGADEQYVTVVTDESNSRLTFSEVWLNIRTNVLERMTDVNASGRQ